MNSENDRLNLAFLKGMIGGFVRGNKPFVATRLSC